MYSEDMELGLREVRKAAGYTSEQLGQEVGMNPTYITRVENGTIKSPSFATIMKLADVLSKSPKITANEINLSDYPGLFPKLVMVQKDQNAIVEAYNQSKTMATLEDILGNTDILTESELTVFNSYAKFKRHFISIDSNLEEFRQQYNRIDMAKKYGAIDKFDFVSFIKYMTAKMEDSAAAELNAAISNLFNAGTIDAQTRFAEVLIGQMQSFMDGYDDVLLEEENKKYLQHSKENLLYNE